MSDTRPTERAKKATADLSAKGASSAANKTGRVLSQQRLVACSSAESIIEAKFPKQVSTTATKEEAHVSSAQKQGESSSYLEQVLSKRPADLQLRTRAQTMKENPITSHLDPLQSRTLRANYQHTTSLQEMLTMKAAVIT